MIAKNGMPVLEEYAHKTGLDRLKNTNILYINHLISDAMLVAVALKQAGANVHTVGIPYGSIDSDERRWVIDEYQKIGPLRFPIVQNSLEFRAKMHDCVASTLNDMSMLEGPLMIVEDGGYAFPILHGLSYREQFKKCIGAVEHTSRGMWNYKYMELDAKPRTPRLIEKPAITIANTKLKNAHEPVFVAHGIVYELINLLKKEQEFLPFRNIAVLGNGKIGNPIANLIESMGANVHVVDPKGSTLFDKRKIQTSLTHELFQICSIFVGASGSPAVTQKQLISFLAEDASSSQKFFASASSKNIEFEAVIKTFDEMTLNKRLCKKTFGSGAIVYKENIPEFGLQYTVDRGGTQRKFSVLAEGYPIIFYPCHTQGAPVRAFDPVMTQLFLAACALRTTHSSLEHVVHTLDDVTSHIDDTDPLKSLLDDKALLWHWCELNGLNPSAYLQQIGYE